MPKPFSYETWKKQIAEAKTREDRYRITLEAIAHCHGRVCENFELCDHPACADSCGATLLALEALREG